MALKKHTDRGYDAELEELRSKLLTLGGCGIWAIIDMILIATRKLPDSDGLPLASNS